MAKRAICSLLASVLLANCGASEGSIAEAIDVCRANEKASLVSPSSYSEVKITTSDQEAFSYEEFRQAKLTSCVAEPCTFNERRSSSLINGLVIMHSVVEDLKQQGVKKPSMAQKKELENRILRSEYDQFISKREVDPTSLEVFIEYDAENSFGASLRKLAYCRFAPRLTGPYSIRDMYDPLPDDTEDQTPPSAFDSLGS